MNNNCPQQHMGWLHIFRFKEPAIVNTLPVGHVMGSVVEREVRATWTPRDHEGGG